MGCTSASPFPDAKHRCCIWLCMPVIKREYMATSLYSARRVSAASWISDGVRWICVLGSDIGALLGIIVDVEIGIKWTTYCRRFLDDSFFGRYIVLGRSLGRSGNGTERDSTGLEQGEQLCWRWFFVNSRWRRGTLGSWKWGIEKIMRLRGGSFSC